MKLRKIQKYNVFNEAISDNPESYSKALIMKLKKTIESFFGETTNDEFSLDNHIEFDDDTKEDKEKSLSEQGLILDDIKFISDTPMTDTLRVIFSDNETNRYDLYIEVNLSDAISEPSEPGEEDFSIRYIRYIHTKLKKYLMTDDEVELVGTLDKKIQVGELTKDFIIEFKVELDDFFDNTDDDDFEILSDDELEEEEAQEEAQDDMDDSQDEFDEFSDEPEEFVNDEV